MNRPRRRDRRSTAGVSLVGALVAACGSTVPVTIAPSTSPAAAPSVSATPALSSAAASPSAATSTASTWSRVADGPLELTEVAAAALGGRIWVAGGLVGSGAASDRLLVYDPATDGWAEGPRLPEPIHHASLVASDGALLLVGGYRGASFAEPTTAVWRLEPAADAWIAAPALPAPRAAGAAAAVHGSTRSVVFGGGIGPDGLRGEVFGLDVDGWRQIGELSTAREHLAATADDTGRSFFLGGRTAGLDTNLGTVDVVGSDQVALLGALPTARGGVAAFWSAATGACLVGGESPGGTNAEVECVGLDGAGQALPALGLARHGLGAAVVDGTAYVLFGGREPGLHASSVVEALALPR